MKTEQGVGFAVVGIGMGTLVGDTVQPFSGNHAPLEHEPRHGSKPKLVNQKFATMTKTAV